MEVAHPQFHGVAGRKYMKEKKKKKNEKKRKKNFESKKSERAAIDNHHSPIVQLGFLFILCFLPLVW